MFYFLKGHTILVVMHEIQKTLNGPRNFQKKAKQTVISICAICSRELGISSSRLKIRSLSLHVILSNYNFSQVAKASRENKLGKTRNKRRNYLGLTV